MSTPRARRGSGREKERAAEPAEEPPSELEASVERRVRPKVAAAIQELTRVASRWKLDRVLPRLLKIIVRATDSEQAVIYLVDERRKVLHCVGQYPETEAHGPLPPEDPLDDAAEAGAPLSMRELPVRHASAESAPGVEMATVPLYVRGRVAGALRLVRPRRRYDDDDLHAAELLAWPLAIQADNARLHAELIQRNQDASLVRELGALFSSGPDVPELAAFGVRILSELMHASDASLLLLDEVSGQLVTAAAIRGDQPGPVVSISPAANSASAAAFRARRPVKISEPESDACRHEELGRACGHVSIVAIPLGTPHSPIGAVVFGQREGGPRLARSLDTAVSVSATIAGAIERTRLIERETRRMRSSSLLHDVRMAAGALDRDILIRSGLDRICATFGLEAGVVSLYAPETSRLVITAWVGPRETVHEFVGSGFLERTARRGAPDREDAFWNTTFVHAYAFPLQTKAAGQLGVLGLARPRRGTLEPDLALVAAAVDELAVGLEACRVFAEANRRVEELKLLLDVARAVSASLDLDAVLESSAGILARMTEASSAFVLLLEEDAAVLTGTAASNQEQREPFRQVRIPLASESLAARAVRTRSTVVAADAMASAEADGAFVKGFGARSIVAVPLLVRAEPIGAVVIVDARKARDWPRAALERAELVAHQVAVAVANARLFEDAKRSYEELARTQEELVKRERLAALGELAAVVAHEVRNPLGVFFNSIGTMQKIVSPGSDAATLCRIMREEACRLNDLVGDLLDFARPKQPCLSAESLTPLIDGAISAAVGDPIGDGLAVRWEGAADLPPVFIDARMMRRALVNLLLNGVQAMDRAGVLTIRAQAEPWDGGAMRARIDVSDTGPGIAPEIVSRLFQPFVTTKASGTGLGLAIVKSIMDAHRAEVRVASIAGAGTTFTLLLPLATESAGVH